MQVIKNWTVGRPGNEVNFKHQYSESYFVFCMFIDSGHESRSKICMKGGTKTYKRLSCHLHHRAKSVSMKLSELFDD